MKINAETTVAAPIEQVWRDASGPHHNRRFWRRQALLPNTARLGARRFADLVLPRQFGRVSDAQYPPHPAPMNAASFQGTWGNG